MLYCPTSSTAQISSPLTGEVRIPLKDRDMAFRSGDVELYSAARANLKRGIRQAKAAYKKKIEDHFRCINTRQVWQRHSYGWGYFIDRGAEPEAVTLHPVVHSSHILTVEEQHGQPQKGSKSQWCHWEGAEVLCRPAGRGLHKDL